MPHCCGKYTEKFRNIDIGMKQLVIQKEKEGVEHKVSLIVR